MSRITEDFVKQETDLLVRFAQTYQPRFAELIDRLNRSHSPEISAQGLRLCIEAMNMMLSAQTQLAKALQSEPQRRAA